MYFVRTTLLIVFLAFFLRPTDAAISIDAKTSDNEARFLLLSGDFEYTDDATSLADFVAKFRPAFVVFNSPGGNIDAAMRYGRMIRALRLRTIQIRSLECASACAFAFMGGIERVAESGSIGVHQSSIAPDVDRDADTAVSGVQAVTAEIIAYFNEMGIDPNLLQLSLTIDSTDIRYLTQAEMQQYGVTTNGSPGVATADPPRPKAPPPRQPAAPAPEIAAIPEASKQTDRIALYLGLDYLGRDIAMVTASDAASCASECLSNRSCQAFTFNTMTRPGRGPNCFLKDSQGQLDGNAAAVSGTLLGPLDADPRTLQFGVIDPTRNLYDDTDFPGYDLSRRPDSF